MDIWICGNAFKNKKEDLRKGKPEQTENSYIYKYIEQWTTNKT